MSRPATVSASVWPFEGSVDGARADSEAFGERVGSFAIAERGFDLAVPHSRFHLS
jgi:hypothetical protein